MQSEKIPQPFPIPKFRQGTQENLRKKILTDSDRKYIVQTLATVMMTYTTKPTMHQCSEVAKALVEQYQFLKDDEGDGEVSSN